MFERYKPINGDEREKLYNEIWKEPISIVCKRYNVSDTTLRKWCIKYGIPVPYSGYWARVRAGQKVKKAELPKVFGETKKYIRNYNLKYREDINDMNYSTLTQISSLGLLREETQVKIIEKCSKLEVNDHLNNPHTLIKEYQGEVRYREKKNIAFSKEDKESKKHVTIKNKYHEDKEILPIKVSNQNLNKTLCFLNKIFEVVEEFEGYISAIYNNNNGSAIYLMNSMILFSVTEAKNKLVFTLYPESYFERSKLDSLIFQDAEELPIENQIGEIVKEIFIAANKLLAMDKLENLKKRRMDDKERRKKLLEKARKGELEILKELTQLATDWENANKIRKFLLEVEKRAQNITDNQEKQKIHQWIKRNKKRVDWLDPLIESYDDDLGYSVSVFDDMMD